MEFRDPDNLVYGKSESGGMVFGGYELDPVSRWEDGVPWDHAARSLPLDYERFAPLMAGAVRRFPFLAEAEVVRLVCHPDAMTPDANPLLGPLPDVHGFWVAAGMSLNGFGGAGGVYESLEVRREMRGGSVHLAGRSSRIAIVTLFCPVTYLILGNRTLFYLFRRSSFKVSPAGGG